MDETLKKLAEKISCNRINFIDKKYDYYNKYMFEEQMKKPVKINDSDKKNKNIKYLDSLSINNKSCIYKSTEKDEGLWKNQFEQINFNNNDKLFNYNTKIKGSNNLINFKYCNYSEY